MGRYISITTVVILLFSGFCSGSDRSHPIYLQGAVVSYLRVRVEHNY